MASYVALLRAVNVGGSSQVRMDDLRALLVEMGYSEVQSILQSGNLIFRAAPSDDEKIEHRLETAIGKRLGLATEVFVRSSGELRRIVEDNPFPTEAQVDPAHLTVAFLKEAPGLKAWLALRSAIHGPERVESSGRQGYIVYPDGIGRSRLTPPLIERSLGTRATSRNWNTVTKLDALAGG